MADRQTAFASREEAIDAAAPGLALADYTKDSIFLSGEIDYLALVVYMPTDAGNEANYKTGTEPPRIDLGISLIAA